MQTLSLQVQETDQGEVQSPIDHAEYTTDESVQNELEGYQEMDGHYEDELDPDDMRALSAEMDHGEKEDELGEYNGTVVRVDLSDAQVILAQTIEAAARANASASETVRIAGLAAEAAVDAARVASKLQAAINGATVNTIEEAVSIAETAAKKAEEAEKRAHGAAQMAKKAVEEARIQTSAARNVQVNGRSVEGADSGPTQVPWVSLGAEKWTTGLKTFHARVGEKLIGAIKTAKVRLWMMLPSSAVE